MSYFVNYRSTFHNRLNNEIVITISKQDPSLTDDDVVELDCTKFSCEYQGDETKYNSILGLRADISFWVRPSSPISAETFLTDYYDTWKVKITCDSLVVFVGFIEPSEGGFLLQDKPYEVNIICTDGLGLLKNVPLSDSNDIAFNNRNLLKSYVQGALAKTNLDLNLRIYCSIYEESMSDRGDGMQHEMFNQTNVHHRTFLKSVNEFLDCYTALEYILGQAFMLYQWNGRWVIQYIPEMQGSEGPKNYWTEYLPNGFAINYNQDLGDPISVGKNKFVEPILKNHRVSYQFPIRSVRTNYKYEVPDNLVNNEKLQEVGSFITPLNAYNIVGWGQYHKFPHTEEDLNNVTPRIKIDVNPYGYELDRYYVLPPDPAAANPPTLRNYIRNLNSDFFVEAGDKIRISVDYRLLANQNTELRFLDFRLLRSGQPPTNSNSWRVLDVNSVWRSGTNGSPVGYVNNIPGTLNLNEWQTFSIEEVTVPFAGNMYICLAAGGVIGGNEIHFKNIKIEYLSLAKGDRTNVLSGDYWLTEQTQNIKDSIEDTIKLSDATRRILKGALWKADGVNLTNPTWYRYGKSESLDFKELVNYGKYRHYHRRFKRISGTFRGVKCVSENNQLEFYPHCFHKHYLFVDDISTKFYMLAAPLTIDYVNGTIEATFIEAMNRDDDVNGDVHKFAYIF